MNTPQTMAMTTPSDREVRFTRYFDAPRELVWEAMTSPEYLPQWMLGPDGWVMDICEVDLRPDGAYRYGWSKENGKRMVITGVFKEVKPPELLVSTENWGGEWPEALNTMQFTEENGRTLMTLTVLSPTKESRDSAIGTGMTTGMEMSYARLDEILKKSR
jgi:uncharacterized protein YndB with AHSA1/START domain